MSQFLAFDLGAESGRAMLGTLDPAGLTLREVVRFANEPVRDAAGWHWDVLRLWHDMLGALHAVSGTPLDSLGVDTWGCDFALVGEGGRLLENPYTYRDTRTDGVLAQVSTRVPRESLYERTGTQVLPFNTLYQLYAACQASPRLVASASALLMMPDLFNYWLTGVQRSEFTIASTSQMVDARTRSWTTPLLRALDLPDRLLQPLVEPGTVLGRLRAEVSAPLAGTPVVAPACHDTASAFASVRSGHRAAVLSSGTWSLLGAEIAAPVISDRTRALNFTNEGGVCGTTRLLKNITGLWLLQSCVRSWGATHPAVPYDELLAAASGDGRAFRSFVDPDHAGFFHPDDMPTAIAGFCRDTGQPEPDGPGACTRAILESLAFKYRMALESLEDVTGSRYAQIRIVGGGSRNRLLNQFTADATGRTVIAGPAEATALGNIAMQMVAVGAVASLDEARAVVERSFPTETFEPVAPETWNRHYSRFQEYAVC